MIIFFSGALPRPCKRVLALTAASLACHRALCAKTFEFHYGLGRHRGLPAGLHPRPCSLFSCEHFGASSSDARVVCGVRCRVLVLATLRVPFLRCFLESEAHRRRFVNLSVVRQRMVTVSNSLVSLLKPPSHPLALARGACLESKSEKSEKPCWGLVDRSAGECLSFAHSRRH